MSEFDDAGVDVTTEQAARALADGSAQVIDVREQHEWDAGRIPGARHIELERLAGRADELPRDRPIVFQCRLGARSAMATQAFRAAGWDAYNMNGGIQLWADRKLPLEPDDGHVAGH